MRKPSAPNRPIDLRRTSTWTDRFANYRHTVTDQTVKMWMEQFRQNDRDLAARILDCIDFITTDQMAAAFRSILNSLTGWHLDPRKRKGKWVFVSFSGSPGESGDNMLYQFRVANKLDHRRYDELFIYTRDLPSAKLTAEDPVVFVDDFAGTGTQACETWENTLQELLPGEPSTYLILIAASLSARDKIRASTRLTVLPHITITGKSNIFSSECIHFTQEDKDKLLGYCGIADRKYPRGYGDCGFVIVFSHRCPNNSIPILHAQNGRWNGLFPR